MLILANVETILNLTTKHLESISIIIYLYGIQLFKEKLLQSDNGMYINE